MKLKHCIKQCARIAIEKLKSDVETGIGKAASWLHDHGAGRNPSPPKNNKLTTDITFLEDFIKKLPA